MKNRSDDPSAHWEEWREEIIGLGIKSYKKNYYQVLQKKIAELESSEHKFHTFFDFVNDAILIHSLDSREILDVNKKAEEMYKFSKKEILKRTIVDLSEGSPPYSQKEVEEWIQKACNEGPQVFEWKSRNAGHRLFWVEVNLNVTILNEREVVIVSIRDIDQRKKNELELEKYRKDLENIVEKRTEEITSANKKLEKALNDLKDTQSQVIQVEKMASLGLMTAGIAHEINNPINYVSSSIPGLEQNFALMERTINLLRKESPLSDNDQKTLRSCLSELDSENVAQEVKDLLYGLNEGVNRTRDIIYSLKSYTKLDSGEKEYESLSENLDLALRMLRNRIPVAIHINRDYRYSGSLYCFSGPLNQVFINLISNAVDSVGQVLSERPGVIQLKTYSIERKREDSVVIEITDNGAGIPVNVLDKIFDPFFSTKKKGESTGLGLFICQRIINEHNGIITVENMEQGCQFKILLPIKGDNT